MILQHVSDYTSTLVILRSALTTNRFSSKDLNLFYIISINKTFKTVDVFIDDCFNKDGSYKVDQDFKKRGVLNKCKWCEFADKPDICDKLYVEREDK